MSSVVISDLCGPPPNTLSDVDARAGATTVIDPAIDPALLPTPNEEAGPQDDQIKPDVGLQASTRRRKKPSEFL